MHLAFQEARLTVILTQSSILGRSSIRSDRVRFRCDIYRSGHLPIFAVPIGSTYKMSVNAAGTVYLLAYMSGPEDFP